MATGTMPSFQQSNLSIACRSFAESPFMPIDASSIGPQIERYGSRFRAIRKEQGPDLVLRRVTIGSLPDEVLLEMFKFYRVALIEDPIRWHTTWPRLVHVCRRWRGIVFASPLGLDLQLYCAPETPVRKMLNVWPALPLSIFLFNDSWESRHWHPDWDNVIAAMEHRDRVHEINFIDLCNSLWAQVYAMMQEPFPALTEASFSCKPEERHVPARLPDTFSAPCLRHLDLERISFPSLGRFLLSTSDLTSLYLLEIPNDGYISPEAMATSLSALTRLEILDIEFASPTPQPKRRTRRLPPHTRSVLSALNSFYFKGVSEYLEVLAARIDAPMLEQFGISFFNQLVFDIPQIGCLIGNLRIPRPSGVSLRFSQNNEASVGFSWSQTGSHGEPYLDVAVLGKGLDWQVFSVAQICNQILPLCSSVEWLNVEYGDRRGHIEFPPRMWPDDMDHRLWLELFHSFTSVKHLEISNELGPFIAAALQGLTGKSAAGVFPALNSLSIVGIPSDLGAQQTIKSFITARLHSEHPVTFKRLYHWTQRR